MTLFQNNQDGYMTVEASLLIPAFIFCVLGVFLVSLYFYDLGTARSYLNESVVLISDVIKTNGENETGNFFSDELETRSVTYLLQQSYPKQAEKAKNLLTEKLKKTLIVSKVNEMQFYAGQKKVTGRLCLSFQVPVPAIGEWIGKWWKNELTVTVENGNNAEQMRRWDQLE